MAGMDADVIVIGAGAAGLAAARHLASASLRVIVLEARDRTGGRVLSDGPDELGAEFIHGPAKETAALLRETGMSAVETGGDSWVCDEHGALRRDDEDHFIGAAAIFEQARLQSHDESVDQFLQRFSNHPEQRATIETARAFVEGFDAADPADASAHGIADEWASGVDFASARPIGGYGPVFAHLQSACTAAGADIRLGAPVEHVSWERGSVTVGISGATPQTLRAKAAVITLPASILRRFEAVLPPEKRNALAHIEMGRAVRVVVRFKHAFWENLHNGRYHDAGFFRTHGQPFAAYWTQFPQRSTSIVAWAGGPKAIALDGTSTADLVAKALHGFGELLGVPEQALGEFSGGSVHDWTSDPYALGAYSYIKVDGANARATLAAPLDNTLFFAGEATSLDGQGGTVNGALETGERAAREAAASLKEVRSAS